MLGSKEVWLLVNGSAKAEIVRRAVKSSIGEDVPASLLREHRNSFLMADAQAAAEI